MNESDHPIVHYHCYSDTDSSSSKDDGETKKAHQNSPVLYNRVVDVVDVPPL